MRSESLFADVGHWRAGGAGGLGVRQLYRIESNGGTMGNNKDWKAARQDRCRKSIWLFCRQAGESMMATLACTLSVEGHIE